MRKKGVAVEKLRATIAAICAALVLAVPVAARGADADVAMTEAEPVRCWWRTTTTAVRVGQTFSVVLTCGAIETDSMAVVVDHSKLDFAAAQLPPFEIVGGTRAPDLRADEGVFFQYEYRLRLIRDSFFDKEVTFPDFSVTYRVQSRSGQGEWVRGAERTYALPPQVIRVVSLVPAGASDIRDASTSTFAEVDAASFRADRLVATGVVLSVVGGLLAVLAWIRLAVQYRPAARAANREVTDLAVLRGVTRELTAVRRDREGAGWTPELVGRALTAFRIIAGYALERPATRLAVGQTNGSEGALMLRQGWLGVRHTLVSGSVTPRTVERELARAARLGDDNVERLERIAATLAAFTRARYGTEDAPTDDALDESLATAERLLQRLSLEHQWVVKKFAAVTRRTTDLRNRLWSH